MSLRRIGKYYYIDIRIRGACATDPDFADPAIAIPPTQPYDLL